MLDILSQVELLEPIPPEGLAQLAARARRRFYRAGDRVMRQGEPSETLHIVVSGRLQVERWHPELTRPLVLDQIGPGEVVGEMGVLEGEPRSATVTALEDAETVELEGIALAETLVQYPDVAAALLRSLSRRLRNAHDVLEQVLRKPQGPESPSGNG